MKSKSEKSLEETEKELECYPHKQIKIDTTKVTINLLWILHFVAFKI